jgi:tRNA U38,U39,U40 pseudouridine synthase TruA
MIVLVQKACCVLAGHHDFSSFRAAGCQVLSCFLTIVQSFYCLPQLRKVYEECIIDHKPIST